MRSDSGSDARAVGTSRVRRSGNLGLASVLVVALGVAVIFSLTVGTHELTLAQVIAGLLGRGEGSDEVLIVRDMRLPRTTLALLVGSALAVSGAVMQGVTGNPLASPSLAGLTSGGSLGLLLCLLLIPESGYPGMMGGSFLGATLAVACVYGVAARSRGGLSPARLALAGIMVSVLLGSITGLLVFEYGMASAGLSWKLGSLVSLRYSEIGMALPGYAAGMLVALVLAPQITVLTLGQGVATGLGQRTERVIFGAMVSVLLLAGTAVSIAGPVAFVGLFVPHILRRFVGYDYRVLIPFAALVGALVVLLADLCTRNVRAGFLELPLGLVTSAIGLPFFLGYARHLGRGGEPS